MSDATPAPAVETPVEASLAADNTVAFTIGGHQFDVPIPTLWDARQTGKHLPPGLVANAEQAIELVITSSVAAAAVGKENLMRACSLGEAIRLVDSLRQIMERAGVPMVPAPAPAAATPAVHQAPEHSPNFPAPTAA